MTTEDKKDSFWGGVAAFMLLSAFIAIGFIVMVGQVFGIKITPPEAWMITMASLVFAAFTYLTGIEVGKRATKRRCPHCEKEI